MIIQGPKRVAYFLPNTFTALNMACGFASIIFAMKGNFYIACLLLLLGAIFDMVDGRVARLTGTQSLFGEQFDSISDVVSFGMAPALLMYLKFFTEMGRFGVIVPFIYLLCGALRLARFNANIDKVTSDFFQGLPIPGAALGVIGFILASTEFSFGPWASYIAAAYAVGYGFLMISNIPFASFKNSEFVKKNKRKVLAIIFLTFSLILLYEQVMILGVISVYVLSCLIYDVVKRKEMATIFDWKEEDEV
ncbi:MAG: CDP-diacylglycerol--serine O-phosphatidyltransferase [Bacteriovorax sp. MedPE-SWde]|nr:MAG: CDP-diacylglycerol--serine O-phosphatidyltransferase [Bacteriovorax sp. MedPE-SWde]